VAPAALSWPIVSLKHVLGIRQTITLSIVGGRQLCILRSVLVLRSFYCVFLVHRASKNLDVHFYRQRS
jgi:hypothetical protein